MEPLTEKDLWPLPVYEGVRDQFRREVIAAKKDRRVGVGPFITLVFENRLTVKFQVQEILRAEKITAPAAVHEELEGFNTMLPGNGELSATLMVELTGPEGEVAAQLAKLSGLGDHLFLELGGERIQGRFDPGRDEGRKFSAVQYVRFPLGDGRALADGSAAAALVFDHPNYSHRTGLSEGVRTSLARDLQPPAGPGSH